MATKKPVSTVASSELDDSLFVGDTQHERDITLPNGKSYTFRFRELSAVEFRRFGIADQAVDEDKRARSIAKLIAASVVNADGSPALTETQAARLKPAPAGRLFEAILEINAADAPGNASTETTGSGT